MRLIFQVTFVSLHFKTKEHESSDCEYTEVACVYESLGCGVRMQRKDEVIHDNEAREKHMDLSLVNVKLLSVKQMKLTATFKSLVPSIENIHFPCWDRLLSSSHRLDHGLLLY